MSMLLFQRRGDEVWLLNAEWPEHVTISHDLLAHADPDHVREHDGKVSIYVQNGVAVYEIEQDNPERHAIEATLLGGMMHPHG